MLYKIGEFYLSDQGRQPQIGQRFFFQIFIILHFLQNITSTIYTEIT